MNVVSIFHKLAKIAAVAVAVLPSIVQAFIPPVSDHIGTIRALVDAKTGETVAEYEYDPYGVLLEEAGEKAGVCPFRFSSKYYDPETQLLYFGYRYYNPASTKWLTVDPLQERGGLNFTAYCAGDPVNNIDPLGMEIYQYDDQQLDRFTPQGYWPYFYSENSGVCPLNLLTVRNCEFNKTQAYGNGGAVSLSRDSSPDGRRYFVGAVGGWQWPPVLSAPEALGGGCNGVISNVVFTECQGGWQGGAISANGRGMFLQIQSSIFEACKGGITHKVDGKGGAIAICGGVQSDSDPENDIVLTGICVINSCQASGNGGGVYVTIRGCVTICDTSITNCSALDEATLLPEGKDFRRVEGMGGGVHVSAGGRVALGTASGGSITLANNTAAVSGGGLSVKSGTAWVLGPVSLSGNKANGNAADGYGNGGGVYVTTSYHDDNPVEFEWSWPPAHPGAGWGAASLYHEDGTLLSYVPAFYVNDNKANRWGGGVYAGISPPWYGSIPPSNMCPARITIQNGSIFGNTARTPANINPCFPAQIAMERIGDGGASADFEGAAISDNLANGIGIYVWDSIPPEIITTTFPSLGIPYLEEP